MRAAPGEVGAQRQLRRFLRGNFSGMLPSATCQPKQVIASMPHLHFGEISPPEIWQALLVRRNSENPPSVDSYLREVGWREFAHHLLFHFPFNRNEPLRRVMRSRSSYRRDAQSCSISSGLVFYEAFAHSLGRRRVLVLGHTGLVDADLANDTPGCNGLPGVARMPHRIFAFSIPCCIGRGGRSARIGVPTAGRCS